MCDCQFYQCPKSLENIILYIIINFLLHLAIDPCEQNPCGKNETCTPIPKTGNHNCTCGANFERIDEVCVERGTPTKMFF